MAIVKVMKTSSVHTVTCCFLLLNLIDFGRVSEWGYKGNNGPDHWNITNPYCGGIWQSPINVNTSLVELDKSLGVFTVTNFNTIAGVKWVLRNTGHSVQVDYLTGSLRVNGGDLGSEYEVAQFQFHWGSNDSQGSEHTTDGRPYPMEMQIVTWKLAYRNLTNSLKYPDGLAVFGFFFQIGSANNPTFDKLVKNLNKVPKSGDSINIEPFALTDLLPSTSSYYRYLGSLTTPSCNEAVIWTVFKTPINISKQQIETFRTLQSSALESNKSPLPLVDNFRPVQNLNHRTVTISSEVKILIDDPYSVLNCQTIIHLPRYLQISLLIVGRFAIWQQLFY